MTMQTLLLWHCSGLLIQADHRVIMSHYLPTALHIPCNSVLYIHILHVPIADPED